MARVQVSDETWTRFRAGLAGTPVSVALGRLVERDVASRHRREAADAGGLKQAADDARLVVDELSELIYRLERFQPRAPMSPASSAPSDVLFD